MKKNGESKKTTGNKTKLLLFVEAFGGGVFTYIVDLANSLSKSYDITIAHGIREQTPKDYASYFEEGITLIHVKNYTREINMREDVKA